MDMLDAHENTVARYALAFLQLLCRKPPVTVLSGVVWSVTQRHWRKHIVLEFAAHALDSTLANHLWLPP
jgi:hypothetical protein